jgi:hypothetical protein
MILAIIVGYSLGTLLAFRLSKWLLNSMAARFGTNPEQERFIKVTGGVLGAIALAPAIFLTAIFGGYLEKSDMGLSAAVSAYGELARLVVPALGLIAITAFTVTLACAMGGAIGVFAARSLFPDRHGRVN